ncbi:MAG: hypothetical protein EOP48_11380 [Sphingobacteriales bacterium]|nr:MAG: hypothetical protein EOP48_11380 [Sphingobacteriales bacterium]
MSTNLPNQVLEDLKEPFQKILSTNNFGDPANEVAELIAEGQFNLQNLDGVLKRYQLKDLVQIKLQVLDMLISYIWLIVSDNVITAREANNLRFLKRFFKIREGDFYSSKYATIETILERQFELMYQDDVIDKDEAIQKVELQEMFDLSYDQFLKLSQKAITSAIDRGADPLELDTFIKSS